MFAMSAIYWNKPLEEEEDDEWGARGVLVKSIGTNSRIQ